MLTLANDAAETDHDWIRAIAMVVAKKAPSEWADEDVVRFRRELPLRVAAFRRLVALHAEHRAEGGGAFEALSVTITRADGREHIRLVGIDEGERPEAEQALDAALAELSQIAGSGHRAHKVLLALLGSGCCRTKPRRRILRLPFSGGPQVPETVRHICGISGGKDSSALAVYLRGKVPEMEYFFCDTGAELPETYEYLTQLEVLLGKPIARLNAERGFDHWFEVFRGALPSPQMRWCTKNMKIKPIEAWIGDEPAVSYVAIRADESNRKGYISTKPNIKSRFPFIEDGIDRDGVMRILEDAGIGLPELLRVAHPVGVLLLLLPAQG